MRAQRQGHVRSATGAAIVVAAAAWTAVGAYAALTSTRWITSRARTRTTCACAFSPPATDPLRGGGVRVDGVALPQPAQGIPSAVVAPARAPPRARVRGCAAGCCASRTWPPPPWRARSRRRSPPRARTTPARAAGMHAWPSASWSAVRRAAALAVAAHLARLSADDDALLARERWRMALDAEDFEMMAPSDDRNDAFEREQRFREPRTSSSSGGRGARRHPGKPRRRISRTPRPRR